MSVVMLATSTWMKGYYVLTIILGCIAVLWSGWPFVGILFVPLGIHMLWATYYDSNNDSSGDIKNTIKGGKNASKSAIKNTNKNLKQIKKDKIKDDKSDSERKEGIMKVVFLCIQGFFVLMITAGSAIALDFIMYKRRYYYYYYYYYYC
jgi:hypothetical protein